MNVGCTRFSWMKRADSSADRRGRQGFRNRYFHRFEDSHPSLWPGSASAAPGTGSLCAPPVWGCCGNKPARSEAGAEPMAV